MEKQTMEAQTSRAQFQKNGFVVVRNLLTPAEVELYIKRMTEVSGISKEDFTSGGARRRDGTRGSYNLPDGVTKSPDFWPIIFNERLLETVRALLGPDIRFLQHTDLHVGFSAVSWHRDSVNRRFGVGPDWDETDAPYRLVRVGLYLQSYAESQFRLGFIPGSQRPAAVTFWRRLAETKLAWSGLLSYVSKKLQLWAADAAWIPTNPGDAIIFDPRTLHSGSYISGPKYSIFVAYGLENKHFYNHHNYYRHIRTELGYEAMPTELVERLQAAALYQAQTPIYDHIDGAWRPMPLLRNILARRFKRPLKTV